MGVSVGEATSEHGDWFGTPVVEAARLCARAESGQVLVSAVVHSLVAARRRHQFLEVGELELKGLPAPVMAYEARWDPLAGAPVVEPPAPRPPAAPVVVPLPKRLGFAPPFGFFGRAAERGALETAWKEAAAGRRQVVMVSGEPGIGKTGLTAELARAVHADGAVVLYGRCDEDLGLPYQPFVEALRDLLVEAPATGLEEWARDHGEALRWVVPELVQRLPEAALLRPVDPETERYRLFQAVSSLLAAVSQPQPVLLVLDDLHWAAKPTLMLLKHVASAVEPMSVLVLGTFRESEISRAHPLAELLAELRRYPSVARMPLQGLGDDEVMALVEHASGQTLDSRGVALAHAVHRESEGNPFFVAEILRHLAESGAVVREGGHWVPGARMEEVGLPASVREVIGQRVQRLGEEAGRVLSLAAVIGRDFDLELLGRVSESAEDRLLDVLDEAMTAALVHEVPGRPGRFTFSHALVQHVLYEELSGLRRVRAHQHVAAALEELCGDDPGDRVAELAHHWLAATRPVDLAKTIDYTMRAGARALSQLAPEEAVVWYGQALELHDTQPGGSEERRADLLIGLGEAQRRAGQAAFRETLLESAAIARRLGDTERLVRAALGNNRGMHSASGVTDGERVAVLEAAAEALGGRDSAERARVLATLALELTFSGEWERRRALADEALAVARRWGDDATLARVLNLRPNAIQVPSTVSERLANTAENLLITERLGNQLERFWALDYRLRAIGESGQLEEIDERLAELDRLAEVLGQPALGWYARFHRSWRELLAGHIGESERLAVEALQIGNDSGQPDAIAIFAAQLAMVRRDQGRLGELMELVVQQAADNPGIPGFRALLALCYCELDRFDEARSVFAIDAASGFADFPYDVVWSSAMAMLAEVCAVLGEAGAAAVLAEKLRPFAGVLAHNGCTTFGALDRYLGMLAATLSHFSEAESHFAAAAAIHDRLGAPAWLARTRLDWAGMLLTRSDPGDAERARGFLGQALAAARELGLGHVERRAAVLLEDGSSP